MKMPGIFVGHGSPVNAIEINEYTKEWSRIGKLFKPKAILMISAHWYTKGNRVQNIDKPQKKDDMYGFTKRLYSLKYSVKGDKLLTKEVEEALGDYVIIDNSWGIDHGAWYVLVHMYPEGNIPVVQLSVDGNKSPKEQYELGKVLTRLRYLGYMILASGNIVHNISTMTPDKSHLYSWAVSFDDYIENAIMNNEYDKCIDYREFGKDALMSVPTPDHYYPLLNLLGSVTETDQVTVFNKGYDFGCISMTGYIFN
ncbi:MAG: 4,5-DOPA dioxygenase extradiol [Clostridiales bacterium]